MSSEYALLLEAAVLELHRNVAASEAGAAILIKELIQARRVALYGVGREGLAVKGLAMRLFHMGIQASVVGEMAAARVAGPRDLLLASAGPGYFSTVAALSKEARRAGARVIILTSQPPTAAAVREPGDVVLQVPACCLPPSDEPAARQASEAPLGQPSPLLMGSSYELALQLFFDLVCVQLQGELGLSTEEMVERHTNLE